jgi:DNA repair protein RecN (Recombination protein N)
MKSPPPIIIGEEEELTARRKVIQNSASLTEMLTRCRENLTGTDALDGVIALLDDTAGALEAAGRTLETLAPLSARVMDYRYELDEIANLVREGLDELEYDPRELDEIEERLDAIRRLKKKYGFSIEEILKFRDSAKAELDLMVQSEEKIKELSVLCEKAQAQAQSLAARLGEGRKKGAARLIEAVKRELIALDMPKVQMDIAFYSHPLSENGAESLEFLLSVNPGETPRPLAKIASGGEMSRIMLAIKSVISAKDDISTLIFDEIDAGISGRAAQKVGAKLRALSSERQVICVTHLAQVAAFADYHLLIEKQVQDQRTFTQVRTLDREGRLRELARIASGDQTTDIALKNAAQMLDMAQEKRA